MTLHVEWTCQFEVLPVFGEPRADLFVVVPDGEARSGTLRDVCQVRSAFVWTWVG